MKLDIVIVEDEPLIAQRLARLTRQILGNEAGAIECAADFHGARKFLVHPDRSLLLLDLSLAGEDGFALLREALAQPCRTIVVSARTDRALEAFDLGVIDFVAKPFTAERLALALKRAQESIVKRTPYLAVLLAGQVQLIPLDTVAAIHGDDDYSSVETVDGRRHLHGKTLSALMEALPPTFRRVHRSHIVNLAHVERILTQESGARQIQLSNGTRVPIGRAYANALSSDAI